VCVYGKEDDEVWFGLVSWHTSMGLTNEPPLSPVIVSNNQSINRSIDRPQEATLAGTRWGGTNFRIMGINTAMKISKEEACELMVIVTPGWGIFGLLV
jgi:hypothetical protein